MMGSVGNIFISIRINVLYLFKIIKLNIIRELQYRTNFVFGFLIEFTYSIVNILFYEIIYHNTAYIGSWNKYQALLLVGTFIITSSMYMTTTFSNLSVLPTSILNGDLDVYLLKPINSKILISYKNFDIGSFLNIFVGIGVVINSLIHLNISLNFIDIVIYFMAIIGGYFLISNSLLILMSLAFWLGRVSEVRDWFGLVVEFGNRPAFIYPKMMQVIFYWILPIFLIANVPIEVLLHKRSIKGVIIFLIIIYAYSLLSSFIYKLGLKKYSSANNSPGYSRM